MSSTAQRVPSVWLLGVASGLSPFGMAIIVPSIGSIAERFDADFASVQFTISAYLFGLAIAQPVCGFLCDRLGRRPVMLAGFALFSVASLACALANSLELLVALRFLQAIGVSVGTVASRAILRDTRTGDQMAEAMSYIAATMGIAPVVAPVMGGFLDSGPGYQWIFVSTALIGLLVLIGMTRHLDETLDTERPPPRWRDWLGSYGTLLRSRPFIGYTLTYGFVQGGFFSFMAIGAVFFATQFAIETDTFGVIWGLMAIAYIVGASLGARFTPRIGTDKVMQISVWIAVIAGSLIVAGASIAEPTPVYILAPLGLMMIVAGSITPGAMAGAVVHHPTIAGTASGLSSALGLVVGGSFSIISGNIFTGNFTPIAWLMLAACVATLLSWLMATLARPGPASAAPRT